MLCKRCCEVFTIYFTNLPDHVDASQCMTHHISLESFAESVAQKCQVCSTVAETIDFTPPGNAVSRFARLPLQQLRSSRTRSKDDSTFISLANISPSKVRRSNFNGSKLDVFTEFQGYVEDLTEQRSEIHFVVCKENETHVPFAKVGRDREVFVIQPCEVRSTCYRRSDSVRTLARTIA